MASTGYCRQLTAFLWTRETSIFLTRFLHDARIGWPRKPFSRVAAKQSTSALNCRSTPAPQPAR